MLLHVVRVLATSPYYRTLPKAERRALVTLVLARYRKQLTFQTKALVKKEN